MDGSDTKCQCARLERPSTGSWMTASKKDGLTFAQWEFIVIKHFAQWELDHICDCALLED